MAQMRNMKSQQAQWYLLYALIAAVGMFALYLVFAGFGIVWLKATTAILAILLSFACLAFLYVSKGLFRPRNLWITAAAASIIVCLLFSLMLHFPCPNKYKFPEPASGNTSAISEQDPCC